MAPLQWFVSCFLLGHSKARAIPRPTLVFCLSYDIWIFIYPFARLILVDIFI